MKSKLEFDMSEPENFFDQPSGARLFLGLIDNLNAYIRENAIKANIKIDAQTKNLDVFLNCE
jgi:hypothetical protein